MRFGGQNTIPSIARWMIYSTRRHLRECQRAGQLKPSWSRAWGLGSRVSLPIFMVPYSLYNHSICTSNRPQHDTVIIQAFAALGYRLDVVFGGSRLYLFIPILRSKHVLAHKPALAPRSCIKACVACMRVFVQYSTPFWCLTFCHLLYAREFRTQSFQV